MPIESIKEDLQAAIFQISKNERIRFTNEETGSYLHKCFEIVEKNLSIDEIQRNPYIVPFLKLIYNGQVIFI